MQIKKLVLGLFFCSLVSAIWAQNIFRTACNGNLVRLDSMLTNTSINTQDIRGMTLLHWAIACKQQKVFDTLVKKGIDINIPNLLDETPMHIAVRFNRVLYFDLLKQAQPNKDWIINYGSSLFEPAILTKNKIFLKKLIESGIDINGTNKRGSTPLEIAQRIKAKEMVTELLQLGADASKIRTIEAKGGYFGQKPPNNIPVMFAPNFISTEEYEFGSIFNRAGDEFYFGVDVNGKPEIRFSEFKNGSWSIPETILTHNNYGYNDPFLSPDEKRLYFISKRALDGISKPKEDHDIWYIEKTSQGWTDPINAGPNINSYANEYYISFTNDGTMYFASNRNDLNTSDRTDQDIYFSKFQDGAFQQAVRLDDVINTKAYEADVFIDPNEKYLIFCSTRSEGFGRGDLYISFKNKNGSWGKAINMGAPINTKGHELCPFVTSDGKYLFYTSKEDIYWVSTCFFDKLKPAE